jgi:hypothetical protein
LKKFFRVTYYTGISIVFVLVAIVGYTQTRGFRASLQEYILSHYHTVLNGDLSIGRIEGNLITGIRLYDVSLRNADTSFFVAERIEFSHDPLALFFKRISLGRVSVVNPRIQLYRSVTGKWNSSDLFVASSDTGTSPWVVTAKNVEFVNARVIMIDSVLIAERLKGLRTPPPEGVVDYARVTLDSLNIECGIQLRPADTEVQLRLMTFTLDYPRLHLKHFQGDFKLTENEVSATNLTLVTDRSRLTLDASLSDINIVTLDDIRELKTKPVNLDLKADNLDTRELKEFLYPWVDFLDREIALQVRAHGEFGRLTVQKVVVETPESMIAIAGTVTNLHRPKDLQLDLQSSNSVIVPDDIAVRLPGLSLPALGEIGKTRFRLTFKGAPTDFESSLKAETEAGNIELNAQLKLGDMLEYKTTFTTGGLNLERLFSNTDLKSSLNLNGTVTGIGTDLYTAGAVARIELDSSEFWGMPIGQSALVLDLSNAELHAHTQLHARSTVYELSSVFQFPRGDSVSYTLKGSVNALNLADIIRNEEFSSDLSFTVKANGKGAAVDQLVNSASFNFLHSSYGETSFENGDFAAWLDLSRGSRSRFSFRSDPLDFDVDGRFTLPSLVENIIDGENIVNDAIVHRFQTLDSLQGAQGSFDGVAKFRVLQNRRPKYVDLSYHMQARNLYPIGIFFRKSFVGSLSMNGAMKGTVDSLDFDASLQVHSFEYRNRSDSYQFGNGTLVLNLEHISRTGLLKVLDSKLDLRTDKFSINNLAFHNSSLKAASHRDSASYEWSAMIDSAYQVDVRGSSLFSSNKYEINLSQLRAGMDFYILENEDPVVVQLGRDGMFVRNLSLTHEVEEVGIEGYFNPSGVSDLKMNVKNFLLNDLKSVLNRTKLAEPVKDVNGILNASLALKGTLKDPELLLDLTANGFRSRDVVFGQVVARSSYSDHLLSLFIELRNKQKEQDSKPDLLVSGTFPYEFGQADSHADKPKGEVNLTLYSKGLNMEFLDPIIPTVSNLTGLLVCDMKIQGNVDDPIYDGSISIQGAKFFFKPLGINFLVQGKLVPNGNRVGLENFLVRNIPQDRPDGQMKLSGTFSLSGLSLRDFDFQADGQLLVMKESSRLAGQKFYGDLFLGTGPGSVRWQGQLSDSRVTGDVIVKNGQITLPPEREVTSIASTAINVIFKDDTSRATNSTDEKKQTSEFTKEFSTQYASLGTVSNAGKPSSTGSGLSAVSPVSEPESKSFLDNIAYDLSFDVQSPTSLRFVFNTQPTEELFADLKGKLAFLKNQSQTRLTGEMSLESRSFYYFFKRFDASGNIDFTGDPVNPELNVTAKYEGTHTLDTLSSTSGTQTATSTQYVRSVSGQRLTSERVDVLLQVSGTKNKPKTKFSLEFPDRDRNSQYVSKDADADAMSFLLTGFLKDELDPQQRGSFLTANMLSGLTAGLITGPLTNALKRQISAIQSVDLQYYGGDWNKTDLRVTAAFSSAVIRFGGRVIEGINNTNVSVEVPVGSMFGSDRFRNLLFKYERKVDAVESIDQRTQSNSLSLFYRIVF